MGDQNATMTLLMGDIALFSVKAVANILLQFSLAIVLAYMGYITDKDVEGLSRVMNYILVPLVAFSSIGSRLSQEIFMQEGWILAVIGLFACFEFFALGWLMRPLAKPTNRFKRLFCVMMALPNLIALPVEITQTLCQLGVFASEFPDVADCNAQALLYIFMYIAFNNFCIWILFFNYLQEGNKLYPADAAANVEDASETKPSATTENTTNLSESTATPDSKTSFVRMIWKSLKNMLIQVFTRPPVLGSVLGLVVGLIPELQYLIFGQGAPLEPLGIAVTSLSQATVPVINLVMAFSIGLKLKEIDSWTGLLGSKQVGAEPRTIISSVVMRGVVLPGIHFGLIYAAFPMLPENRLFRLVLLVSAICPTASIVVALAHIAGLSDLAKVAAFAIIPQYVLAVPGLVLFLTAALLAIG